MTARRTHRIVAGLATLVAGLAPLAALVLTPRPATSTADLMTRLPAYQKYKCVLCHTSSSPVTGSSDLNTFGVDFAANDNVWDKTLALLNSDDDRCLNGFELSDQDGDGVYDYSGDAIEHSNPGNGADCSIALTVRTWGKIKELFRNEMPDYFGGGELYDYNTGGVYDAGSYPDGWPIHFP